MEVNRSVAAPSVLFLVYREGLGPIFSSVYLNPAAKLAARGVSSRILVFSSLGEFIKGSLRRRWMNLSLEVCRRVPGGMTRLPGPPGKFRWLETDPIVLGAWAALNFRRPKPCVIHCGASRATLLALNLRKHYPWLRVVYHSWGPEAAEFMFAHRAKGQVPARAKSVAAELDAAQGTAMREADAIICISRRMLDWAKDTYGICPSRIAVVPCFVDVNDFATKASGRDQTRRELGFGDDFVVAYCGSMIPWQMSTKSLEALAVIRRIRPDTRFLGVTMHTHALARLLSEVGFPQGRAVILTVPHSEVPRYLAAADLGFIGRNLMQAPDIVSDLSSPVKFGEYLACGTPVLISERVGDFSDLTTRNRVGIVVPCHSSKKEAENKIAEFIDRYTIDSAGIRSRCVETALQELDIENHISRLADLYSRLLTPSENRHQ